MPFYTCVADYRGGTYVSQVTAETPSQAVLGWAEALEVSTISGIGPQSKAALLQAIHTDKEEAPVPLDGLQNVWCSCFSLRGKLLLLNLIETV